MALSFATVALAGLSIVCAIVGIAAKQAQRSELAIFLGFLSAFLMVAAGVLGLMVVK